jgi:hypothetical protein
MTGANKLATLVVMSAEEDAPPHGQPPTENIVVAARDLLARTVELPRSKKALFAVLSEYRAVVHAFAVADRARQ